MNEAVNGDKQPQETSIAGAHGEDFKTIVDMLSETGASVFSTMLCTSTACRTRSYTSNICIPQPRSSARIGMGESVIVAHPGRTAQASTSSSSHDDNSGGNPRIRR
jgi:hypothetical protein